MHGIKYPFSVTDTVTKVSAVTEKYLDVVWHTLLCYYDEDSEEERLTALTDPLKGLNTIQPKLIFLKDLMLFFFVCRKWLLMLFEWVFEGQSGKYKQHRQKREAELKMHLCQNICQIEDTFEHQRFSWVSPLKASLIWLSYRFDSACFHQFSLHKKIKKKWN